MREIIFEEKRYYITEKEWQQLLKRFDPDGEISREYGREITNIPCICVDNIACIGCNLDNPRGTHENCMLMVAAVLECDTYRIWDTIFFHHSRLSWPITGHDKALEAKGKIYKALLGLKKVPRRKK